MKEMEFLTKPDVWSKLLHTFYKLSGEVEFTCELPFIMNEETLLKLVDYFGGKTITIPSRSDLIKLAEALQYFDKGLSPRKQNIYFDKLMDIENGDL